MTPYPVRNTGLVLEGVTKRSRFDNRYLVKSFRFMAYAREAWLDKGEIYV